MILTHNRMKLMMSLDSLEWKCFLVLCMIMSQLLLTEHLIMLILETISKECNSLIVRLVYYFEYHNYYSILTINKTQCSHRLGLVIIIL